MARTPTRSEVERAWTMRQYQLDEEAGKEPDPLEYSREFRNFWKAETNAALTAAGVAPQPVIDEAALAEVIGKVTDLWDEPLDEVHDIPQIARAVAAWLKDGAR